VSNKPIYVTQLDVLNNRVVVGNEDALLSGSLPSEKMGYYMGVFNFFIVIPQIIAGTILGFLLNNLVKVNK